MSSKNPDRFYIDEETLNQTWYGRHSRIETTPIINPTKLVAIHKEREEKEKERNILINELNTELAKWYPSQGPLKIGKTHYEAIIDEINCSGYDIDYVDSIIIIKMPKK